MEFERLLLPSYDLLIAKDTSLVIEFTLEILLDPAGLMLEIVNSGIVSREILRRARRWINEET